MQHIDLKLIVQKTQTQIFIFSQSIMEKAISTAQQRIVDIFESLTCEFICPITQMPMQNPVITEDGHSYEQGAIYKWLLASKKSPKTGLVLENTKLTSNHCLKQLIEKLDFLKNEILHEIYQIITPIMRLAGFDNLRDQFPILSEQVKLKQQLDQKLYEGQGKAQQQPNKYVKIEGKNDQVFQKWLKIIDSHIHYHPNELPQNYLLQPYQYLLQKFNSSSEQIADRYRKDRYTHELGLWHNNIPIDSMIVFVKYDWNVLQFINLCKCEINDQAWILLVKNAKSAFSQIKTIWIYGNFIRDVEENDIMAFVKIKEIQFSHYNGLSNPLTIRSKQNIKRFKSKEQNKHIYVQYTE